MAASKRARTAAKANKKRIFISHSTADSWVAKHVADDLEKRGVDCFLAIKQLATGADIAPAIRRELRNSDELLLLLSPASVKSAWVMSEISMADVLEMPIAPILLHLGANDLPPIVQPYLARDLNDIDRYYEELQRRRGTTAAAKRAVTRATTKTKAKVVRRPRIAPGDRVRVIDAQHEDVYRPHGKISWVHGMNEYRGQTATVMEIDKKDGSAQLDIDPNGFWWAFEWLTKLRR
jgi:TIR domain